MVAATVAGSTPLPENSAAITGLGPESERLHRVRWGTPRALVRGPIYEAMSQGWICRFEEVTRVQPEIQDCLISVMSDKMLRVPELDGEASTLFGSHGFNILATANIRDRGVHEMSSALKRRFNFETVRPIADRKQEMQLVREQTESLLERARIEVDLAPEVIDLLVTSFNDLRTGATAEGVVLEKPTAVMSSAEAVSVGFALGYLASRYQQQLLSQSKIDEFIHYAQAWIREQGPKIADPIKQGLESTGSSVEQAIKKVSSSHPLESFNFLPRQKHRKFLGLEIF